MLRFWKNFRQNTKQNLAFLTQNAAKIVYNNDFTINAENSDYNIDPGWV
jgi:hypothetical protein